MTLDELKTILKSKNFKSSVKNRQEHYLFSFTEIYIFRDSMPIGIYELTKTGENFTIVISQKLQDVFTDDFKNIILVVPGDNRFPVIINFDSLVLQQRNNHEITFVAQ